MTSADFCAFSTALYSGYPLMWLDKAETWALADQLGAFDYVREKTLTCYNGIIGTGCGECPACHLRQKGLEKYLAERGEA